MAGPPRDGHRGAFGVTGFGVEPPEAIAVQRPVTQRVDRRSWSRGESREEEARMKKNDESNDVWMNRG